VRFDRHADHEALGFSILSVQSGQHGDPRYQFFFFQRREARFRLALQSLYIDVFRHDETSNDGPDANSALNYA
jgi:hypothetical protein